MSGVAYAHKCRKLSYTGLAKEYAWSMPVIHMEYACNMPVYLTYAWNMRRICKEHVSDMHGYVWNMQGICMDCAWNMHEVCMDYAWNMHGLCMEYA